jgi:cytoskeletal protein CcmA (bactofilin family)
MKIGLDKDTPQTIIGKSVTVKGEILGNEQLTIEGTVEGRIMIETTVLVRDSGIVKADVDAANVNVAGGVIGNISVSERIEIVSGGYVVGDIRAPRLIINDGASVKGNIDMEIKSEHANSGRNPENDTTRSDSTSIDGTS